MIARYAVMAMLALSAPHALAQTATGSFRQELTVAVPLEVDAVTGSGRIGVRSGSADRAIVVGRISVRATRGRTIEQAEEIVRRLEAQPPVELQGNRLRIGQIDDEALKRDVSVSYEIEVPAQSSVHARSGSGSQTVAGLRGAIDVSTGSGGIELTDIGGSIDAHTGSGSIRADRIGGEFRADTGSGSVSLVQTTPGDVSIKTSSGSVDASGVQGALRVTTGSGSVRVQGTQQGAWALETGSGSITVRVPEDAAFTLDAQASSGGVFSDHPIAIRGAISRGRLNGQVRGGGQLLQARTGSGAIRIE